MIVIGLLLSSLGFIAAQRRQRRGIEQEVRRAASDRASALRRGLQTNLSFLESLHGFYEASDKVERAQFRQFVDHFLRLARHPAVQALEWIPRVPHSQRARYEEEARREGLPDFQITERKTQGLMTRAADREEYFPVYFVEPHKGNETAVGFDLASNARRLEALRHSRDTGQMVATARITLVQETASQAGFLVFLPVYRKNVPIRSVAERRENLEGFILGVFRIGDMVETALAYLEPQDIDISIFDNAAPVGERFLYRHHWAKGTTSGGPRGERSEDPHETLRYSATLEVAGRKWLVVCMPTPDYIAAQKTWHPWTVLVAGVVSTGLLAAYIFGLLRGTAKARKFAADMFKAKQTLEREMSKRQKAKEALRESEERFRTVFNACQDMIVVWNLDYLCLYGNQAAGDMVNTDGEPLTGHTIDEVLSGMPVFMETWKAMTREVLEADASIRREISFNLFGTTVTFESVVSPLRNADGRIFAVGAVCRDITQRKQSESLLKERGEMLEDRTRALVERNRELQQFAYVASHDLQEPLRMVASYVQLIERRYKDRLDADAHEFIDFAVDGAKRMQALINALLEYSRVGTHGKDFAATDCNVVFQNALKSLQVAIDEKHAEVTADDLPTVQADEVQLGQLFQNLIENALKFQSGETPRVHVSAQRENGSWQFAVQDNGIGLDEKDADRIFTIFQRLHGREEYPGTGIGLAVCKKIVERHGGCIWVESAPGTGSTFHFTLPTVGEENHGDD